MILLVLVFLLVMGSREPAGHQSHPHPSLAIHPLFTHPDYWQLVGNLLSSTSLDNTCLLRALLSHSGGPFPSLVIL